MIEETETIVAAIMAKEETSKKGEETKWLHL